MPLYLALAGLPLFALFQIYINVSRAFGWAALAYAPQYVLRPAFLMVLVLVLIVISVKTTAISVLVASLVASALAFAWQALVLHRRKPHVTEPAKPAYHGRAWLTVAFSMAMFNGFQLITTYGDVLILGNFVEPDKIGIYNASVRAASIINFVLMAMSATATPKYAELYARNQHDELRTYVTHTARWIFWPSLAGAIVLVAGYPVLLILVLSNLVLAATGNVDSLLNMTGHQRVCARIMVWSGIAFIVLNFALIPLFGVVGAALAVCLSLALKFSWMVVIAKKRLGILALVTPSWPRLGRKAAA